jgi:hypothetical protein
MAYVSQEMKKELAPAIKALAKEYGYKVSLGVQHHMTLVAKIKGAEDILEEYCEVQMEPQKVLERECRHYKFDPVEVMADASKWGHRVNEYWISENYGPKGTEFLTKMKSAMEGPDFFCEDDSMTDYFHRSHYIEMSLYA